MKFNTLCIKIGIMQLLFSIHTVHTLTQAVYVVSGNEVQLINGATNALVTTISLPASAASNGIAIVPDGFYAYVGATTAALYLLNLTTSSYVSTISTGLSTGSRQVVATPDGEYIITAVDAKISVVSTVTNTLIGTTTLTGLNNGSICYIAINPVYTATITGFVADTLGNIIPISINRSTGGVTPGTAFTGTGATCQGMAITPNGATLYVSSSGSNLYPVNTSTNIVGSPISLNNANCFFPVISPNGSTLYLSQFTSTGAVEIVNLNTQLYVTSVNTGASFPWASSITTDGLYLYVPNSFATSVTVISTATNTVYTTISGLPNDAGVVAITPVLNGTLDSTFGNNGFTLTPISRADSLQAAAIQTSVYEPNKIVVTGTTQTTGPSLFLGQYTSSGILDTGNFNSTGSTPGYQILQPTALSPSATSCAGNALALDSSSNILVAGYATQTQTNMLLTRYIPSGILDTTFNSTGYIAQSIGSGATANAVGVQDVTYSGRIIAGGCSIQNGTPCFTLAGFTSTGSLDTTFGVSGITTTIIGNISIIKALAVIPSTVLSGTLDDYIIAVGIADNHIAIARYKAQGILDTTFGTSGIFKPTISSASSSSAYSVELDSSGNILIAGSATISGIKQSLLMRCLPAGSLDTSFNSTGYVLQSISYGSEYYSLAILASTNIMAGGYAIGALANQISLARYSTLGVIDPLYGPTGGGVSLNTIGSTTAAQSILLQSTQAPVTAATADGVFYVARFS